MKSRVKKAGRLSPTQPVVLDKDGLTKLLVERCGGKPERVGRVLTFVTRAFQLQNDEGRPAYIFEVHGTPSAADVKYISKCMTALGVCCALIPDGMVDCVAKVTPRSMGVRNVIASIKRRFAKR